MDKKSSHIQDNLKIESYTNSYFLFIYLRYKLAKHAEIKCSGVSNKPKK